MDDNHSGGLPEEVQREIVDGVVHAVLAWSAGRPAAVERPQGDELAEPDGLRHGRDGAARVRPAAQRGHGLHGASAAPAAEPARSRTSPSS